jgi:hypothetical protein
MFDKLALTLCGSLVRAEAGGPGVHHFWTELNQNKSVARTPVLATNAQIP